MTLAWLIWRACSFHWSNPVQYLQMWNKYSKWFCIDVPYKYFQNFQESCQAVFTKSTLTFCMHISIKRYPKYEVYSPIRSKRSLNCSDRFWWSFYRKKLFGKCGEESVFFILLLQHYSIMWHYRPVWWCVVWYVLIDRRHLYKSRIVLSQMSIGSFAFRSVNWSI